MTRLVLVTGPAGAGKSATAAELAGSRAEATALLSHDLVYGFVRSGFLRPDKNWNDATERQWMLARDVCVSAAGNYLNAGLSVVIEAYAPGGWPGWQVPGGVLESVVLLPSFDVVVKRNAERDGLARLDPGDLKRNYEGFRGSLAPDVRVLDNSDLSVSATCDAISALLEWPRSRTPPLNE
jgi:cytidylate kinase